MADGSVIGQGTVVRGNVRGQGPLEILGRVEGDVTIDGDVLLGEAAAVRGNVSGAQITVGGRVLGDLNGSDAVLLEPTARVVGDIIAPRIGIGGGALVRGNVRTEGEASVTDRRRVTGNVHRLPQRVGREARTVDARDTRSGDGRAEARSSEMRGEARRSEARTFDTRFNGTRGNAARSRSEENRSPAFGRRNAESSGRTRVTELRSEAHAGTSAESVPPNSEAGELALSEQNGQSAHGRAERPPPPLVPALPKGVQAKKKRSRKR